MWDLGQVTLSSVSRFHSWFSIKIFWMRKGIQKEKWSFFCFLLVLGKDSFGPRFKNVLKRIAGLARLLWNYKGTTRTATWVCGVVRDVWVGKSCFSSPAFMKAPLVGGSRERGGKVWLFSNSLFILGLWVFQVKGSSPWQCRGFRLTQRSFTVEPNILLYQSPARYWVVDIFIERTWSSPFLKYENMLSHCKIKCM